MPKQKTGEVLKFVEALIQQIRLLDPLVDDVASEAGKTAHGQTQFIQCQPSLLQRILNTPHISPGITLACGRGKGLHRNPQKHDSIRRWTQLHRS
jgi:hypothetical protein